jgi:hypothetical protein
MLGGDRRLQRPRVALGLDGPPRGLPRGREQATLAKPIHGRLDPPQERRGYVRRFRGDPAIQRDALRYLIDRHGLWRVP